jgi:hypothetical protein
MDVKYSVFAVLLICAGTLLRAQANPIDTTYVVQFPDKITVRMGLVNTSNSFFINDKASKFSYTLKPNTREYLGFSLLFRSVELDFGFLPGFFKENQDNSNSKLFNLNLRMFLGKFVTTDSSNHFSLMVPSF